MAYLLHCFIIYIIVSQNDVDSKWVMAKNIFEELDKYLDNTFPRISFQMMISGIIGKT